MREVIDETGNKYGKLFVVECVGRDKYGNALWKCLCDCGNGAIVSGTNLRHNRINSCGCLRTLPEGEAALNAIISHMKQGAKKRSLEWQLTKEQVRELTQSPCYYCGIEPSQVWRDANLNGTYIYNGLDRMDNKQGYTIDNIVPCCKDCNLAKRTRTVEEFRSWVYRLYENFKLLGG